MVLPRAGAAEEFLDSALGLFSREWALVVEGSRGRLDEELHLLSQGDLINEGREHDSIDNAIEYCNQLLCEQAREDSPAMRQISRPSNRR